MVRKFTDEELIARKYAYTDKWQKNNPEAVKRYNQAYYKKNREKILAKTKAKYAANEDGYRDKAIKRWIEYRKNHTEKFKDSQRKSRHGISGERFRFMLNEQKHLCASCLTDLSKLRPHEVQVDHCHISKKIRAILCGPCNRALGLLNDDPIKAQNLANYIKLHSS